MAKNTIENETRKLLERVRKGKVTLKKASILLEDLEIQMTLLVKEREVMKAGRLKSSK